MTTTKQKIREAATVAVLMALSLVALRSSAKAPGETTTLDRTLQAAIAPLQAALARTARSVTELAGRYVDLVHVRAENETLHSENARLKVELFEAKRQANESVRFQKLLGLRDATPAETIVARVISIGTSPHFRSARIVLDRGADYVKPGMPVITPEGVVGRINNVAGDTSDIILAVDPTSAIAVMLPRTGGRGILRGKAGENGYRCTIEYLVRGDEAREGDAVVTSGLGNFPLRDLPVGKISRATKGGNGLYQDVEVTPDVDFARLSEVLVVVAPPPSPDPDAGTRRGASPARGLTLYR